MADDKMKWCLMSGAEAQQIEHILELFQRIKGRPATSEERGARRACFAKDIAGEERGAPFGAGWNRFRYRGRYEPGAEKAHLIERNNTL